MPIRWGELPNQPPIDSPTLGQHNRKVLADILGRSEADLEALQEAGVLLEKNV